MKDDRDQIGLISGIFEVQAGETLTGIAASHGIAIGRAYLVDRRRIKVPKRRVEEEDEIENEVERFQRALEQSDRQFEKIKKKIAAREDDHYNVITAHQLILHDEHLVDETIRHIRDSGINAEWALRRTVEHVKGIFDAVEDDYFRERRSDVEFVGERVMRNLMGHETRVLPPPDAVVVAHDLSPADTAQVYRAAVAGIVTDAGGKTSHTAIVARTHEVPCVVGLENITGAVQAGDLLIVDGTEGKVIIKPPPETVAEYRERARRQVAAGAALLTIRDLPAQTVDGVEVTLRSNIDNIDEIPSAISHGARGIGLFRTEYLYMGVEEFPDEETHYQLAVSVLEQLGGADAVIRTIDFGADKVSKLLQATHAEANPALGLRSVRLCLTDRVRPVFKQQLRGLLRASVHGPIKIMFPMISGLHELEQVLEVLDDCRGELKAEGKPFAADVPIGVMVETPGAAMVADHLARHVDFFSIGTNDLIQYTLAVDRVNEHVSYLYEPMHPAILRLIEAVVRSAREANIPVSLCGEMAGDPEVAPLLVGLGLRELSMHSVAVPEVKSVIRAGRVTEWEALVREVIGMASGPEVRKAVLALRDRSSDQ